MKTQNKNFSEIGEYALRFILGARLFAATPAGFYVQGLHATDKKEVKLVLGSSGYT
ncbi:MAG: hypothetical protein KJO63_14950 [Maribacter sp.]|nr:hypothetical protein [Maribacter sp.]